MTPIKLGAPAAFDMHLEDGGLVCQYNQVICDSKKSNLLCDGHFFVMSWAVGRGKNVSGGVTLPAFLPAYSLFV